jgi:hypothetical protein
MAITTLGHMYPPSSQSKGAESVQIRTLVSGGLIVTQPHIYQGTLSGGPDRGAPPCHCQNNHHPSSATVGTAPSDTPPCDCGPSTSSTLRTMPNFGKANALKQDLTPTLVWIALFSCTGAFTFGSVSHPQRSCLMASAQRKLISPPRCFPTASTTVGGAG